MPDKLSPDDRSFSLGSPSMSEQNEEEIFIFPECATRTKPTTRSLCHKLGLLFLVIVLTLITGLTAILIWEVMLSQRHRSPDNHNVTDAWMTTVKDNSGMQVQYPDKRMKTFRRD